MSVTVTVDVIELPHLTLHHPEIEFTYYRGSFSSPHEPPELEEADIHRITLTVGDEEHNLPVEFWQNYTDIIQEAIFEVLASGAADDIL